jgi:transposase
MAATGGEVRKVSPMHTSTTCSCCGVNEKKHRKSQAVYECDACGSAMNADHNAAINILRPERGQRRAGRPSPGSANLTWSRSDLSVLPPDQEIPVLQGGEGVKESTNARSYAPSPTAVPIAPVAH